MTDVQVALPEYVLAVTFLPKTGIDEYGELCGQCDAEYAPVNAQFYYAKEDGERSQISCCLDCLLTEIKDNVRRGERVVVEVADELYV
jgi:hypothetical protein